MIAVVLIVLVGAIAATVVIRLYVAVQRDTRERLERL